MNQSASFTAPTQEEISQRARELWESYGRPEGRDNEIWLEAERQLLGVDAKVESNGDASISAGSFDEATSQDKPRTRLTKTSSTRKPASENPEVVPAKTEARSTPSSAGKRSALARTGGPSTPIKAPSTVRPKR